MLPQEAEDVPQACLPLVCDTDLSERFRRDTVTEDRRLRELGSSTLNRGGVRLQRKQGSRHTSSWDAPQHNQEKRMVMDPTTTFCPNLACPARGQIGQGNI